GVSKKMFYGTNPHGDTETLTDATTGATTSTYRYTAYGQADKAGTTGDDKIMDDSAQDADVVNPYRFNSSRFDGATGTYDMGFREYNPSLNRFLTRDMYDGALGDMGLGADPWNTNRYMFGGGNPIGRIELDGHINESLTSGGGRAPEPVSVIVGSREVAAEDSKEFDAAYDAVESELIGGRGGQGHAGTVGCNNLETWKVENGKTTTCGWSDVKFSNKFANALCQQPGIRCGPYTPTGPMGVGLGHDGGAVRLTGGPEAPTGSRAMGGGDFCSFSGETLVEMGDGSRKPISQVKVGDEVLAADPETGERGPRRVTHLWVHTDTLLELEVEGGLLTTTEDHPFWNATDSEFQRADQLDAGDQLVTPGRNLVRVKGIRPGTQRGATAYNLTVDDIHTYYVLAGNMPVLVHNNSGCGPYLKDLPKDYDRRTVGILDVGNDQLPMISGPGGQSGLLKVLPGRIKANAGHVETHAAAFLRMNPGIRQAVLYIDYPSGTCGTCRNTLRDMLPEGVELWVRSPQGTERFVGLPN
ncbi:polymorphic toxin-type HINT domain-containing protein, partial [Kribbella sp. NPDC050124]|uniref:polymorphic toxin-type HINT domain-containing protein n=1 Tax=Kribbella sp. NPDC050124 TaxID=3364114 RepID=UPI0037AD9CC3